MNSVIIAISTDDSMRLKIESDQASLGSQYDSGALGLAFQRPQEYAGDDLILYFFDGIMECNPVNLGNEDFFTVEHDLTAREFLRLQIAFKRDGTVLEHSNILEFSLQKSLPRAKLPGATLLQRIDTLEQCAFAKTGYEDNKLTFRNVEGADVAVVEISGGSGGAGTAGPKGDPGKDGLTVSVNGRQHVNGDIALRAEHIPVQSTLFQAANIEEALSELFTSVSDGKAALAADIADKGGFVNTEGQAPSFQELSQGIASIPSGGNAKQPMLEFIFELEVSDGTRIVHKAMGPNRNFYNICARIITGNLAQTPHRFGAGSLSLKNYADAFISPPESLQPVNSQTASPVSLFNLINNGIYLGKGTAPESFDEYMLSIISDGSTSGKLTRGATQYPVNYDYDMETKTYRGKFIRAFTNNSGSDVTVTEIGLYGEQLFWLRTLLPKKIVMLPAMVLTVNLTIAFHYPEPEEDNQP